MDRLGAHIIEVLNASQKVYLPGLGTFKKERIPAQFDDKTNSFLAPSKKVILINEKGSAAQLITRISQEEKISEEETENQLKNVVGSLLLELNEKGTAEIVDFGKLIKTEDAIIFVEDVQEEDLPFYKSVSEIKLIQPSKTEPLSPLEESDTEEQTQEFEPRGKPINWLWPALIIVALIISGTIWFLNSEELKVQGTQEALTETTKSDIIPDTASTIANSDTTQISAQDTVSSTFAENVETVTAKPTTTYEIIVVSFGKLSEAENYVKNMNAKGYKIRILENKNPGNLYKISYASFSDEAEAQLELNKVREDFSKDAWIFKKKN